jgi:hypothetical protein
METIEISTICTIIFWVFAIISSIFYSAFALKIHLVTLQEGNAPWIIHQRWFNFVGSIIGWIILWIILPDLLQAFGLQSTKAFSLKEIILCLLALLGITGHLPMTLFGIARSSNELAKKIANTK